MISNIILVGMPACGKSTVGVVLAKTINKNFVDTDLLIQRRCKMTLQEILDNHGKTFFGQIEEAVLDEFDGEDCVVSTGGSAIYYEKAINKFKEKGTVVYLKVSLETVLARLHNIKTRGVTLEKGQTLEDLYEERIPLYERFADITIEADDLQIEEVIEKIIEEIEE